MIFVRRTADLEVIEPDEADLFARIAPSQPAARQL